MKDAMTFDSFGKSVKYGGSMSYPHRMDYIRITELMSNRKVVSDRRSGLSGSPSMWWTAAGIIIISALFLLCLFIA